MSIVQIGSHNPHLTKACGPAVDRATKQLIL